MAKIFLISSYTSNQNRIVKKNRFVVYKNTDNHNGKGSLNYSKSLNNLNIRFNVYHFKSAKKCKMLKNNKSVYSNNKAFSKENIRKGNQIISQNIFKKSFRSSSYRGVSKNGNKWQVLLMDRNNKYYLGNYKNEIIAAKIYDLFSIKIHGKRAITNFIYTDKQINI